MNPLLLMAIIAGGIYTFKRLTDVQKSVTKTQSDISNISRTIDQLNKAGVTQTIENLAKASKPITDVLGKLKLP
jgi:hypothetical protein